MTRVRRDGVITLALVVSVAVHIALMFFVKPEVMVHVSSSASTSAHREAMRVTKAPDEPALSVTVNDLLDLKPLQDAPPPTSVSAVPMVPPADSSAVPIAPTAVSSVASEPELPVQGFDVAPIRAVEESQGGFAVPKIEAPLPAAPVSAPSSRVLSVSPHMRGGSGAGAPAPVLPTAPTVQTPSAFSGRVDEAPKSAETFKPAAEIYEKVDERVVVAEREAVRKLVNADNAVDLASSVKAEMFVETRPDCVYFKVTIAPRASLPVVPKDVVVILDASGSIGKDRMGSIRGAAKRLLREATNSGDRFNLVAFRDRYSYAFRAWQPCSQTAFDRADRWLSDVAAHGRTDVFSTIRSVLTLPRDPTRPVIALVVTDGDANVGVSETADILAKFSALNDGLISVYMYGVKSSANRELIDVLTHGNRGESFIYDGWRWSAGSGIGGLATRFRDPVLTDLRVVVPASLNVDLYPHWLRNLYRGDTLALYGRAPAGTQVVSFSIKGLNGARAYEDFFSFRMAEAKADRSIGSAWQAERRIDSKLR